jgi:hypothetical protein
VAARRVDVAGDHGGAVGGELGDWTRSGAGPDGVEEALHEAAVDALADAAVLAVDQVADGRRGDGRRDAAEVAEHVVREGRDAGGVHAGDELAGGGVLEGRGGGGVDALEAILLVVARAGSACRSGDRGAIAVGVVAVGGDEVTGTWVHGLVPR